MARTPPIAVRNDQVFNQIAVDFSARGAREEAPKKQAAGTVYILSRDKIRAARGAVAPDQEEEARKVEQEMRRILEEEDEAKRARGGGVDRASAHEKSILTQEEIDALLSSDTEEENGNREGPGGDILTQEEIDALLQVAESADSDAASEEVDDDFLAAMEEALEELNQQRAEEEKRQPKREAPSDPDVE